MSYTPAGSPGAAPSTMVRILPVDVGPATRKRSLRPDGEILEAGGEAGSVGGTGHDADLDCLGRRKPGEAAHGEGLAVERGVDLDGVALAGKAEPEGRRVLRGGHDRPVGVV